MKTPILLISFLAASTYARPGGGYSYPVPAGPTLTLPSIGGSHGISSISSLGSSSSHGSDISQISLTTTGSGSSLGHGSSSYLSGGSSLLSGGSSLLSGGSSLLSGGSSLLSGGSTLLSGGIGSSFGDSALGHAGSFSSSLGNAGSFSSSLASSGSFGSFGSSLGGGGTLVQKHIYVHVPPPEPEDLRPQRIIPVAPAQKHYKIIFIKAPSPPTPTLPSIPLQPQNEEKTLVYVLVKKPEEAPELTIPAPVPTQPSKPEVYFIRYKTQKDNSLGSTTFTGGSLGSTLDDTSAALAQSSLGSFSGSSSSSSSFISSASASSSGGSLSSSYGPPGHVPGPY